MESGLSDDRIGRSQLVEVLLTQHNWSTKGDEVRLGGSLKLSILSEAVTGDGVAYSVAMCVESGEGQETFGAKTGVVVHELRGQGVEQTIRGTLKMLQMISGTWWRGRERQGAKC